MGVPYLKESDKTSIYLDVLVCLNMVKRISEGQGPRGLAPKDALDNSAMLESYGAMVEEARLIGVPDFKILERLESPRFLMNPTKYKQFLRKLGLDGTHR